MDDELSNYLLTIDTTKAHEELNEVDQKRKQVEEDTRKTIETVDQETQAAFRKAVSVMQGTWHAAEGILRTLGVAIPQVLRTSISGAFAAAKILLPIFTAEAVTPGMQVQAAIGFAQIGFSIAAAVAAQREADMQEQAFNDINSMLGGINSLVGVWSF